MEKVIAEKKAWLDGIVEKYRQLNDACDAVIKVGAMNIDGPLCQAIWGAWEYLLQQCDHDDWISWYIYDNDCGKKGHRVYLSGSDEGIVIDSTEALARFLVTEPMTSSKDDDKGATLAGELIAMIRLNALRGTFATATVAEIDEHLQPWIARLLELRAATPTSLQRSTTPPSPDSA